MWKLRINIIALVGAIIGLISLSLIWLNETTYSFGEEIVGYQLEGWQLMQMGGWYYLGNEIAYPIILFAIGTYFAFFSPFGAFPQIIGVSGFLTIAIRGFDLESTSRQYDLNIGPWIALASSIIVLIGLLFPWGIGLPKNKKKIDAFGRLLTFSIYKQQDKMELRESLEKEINPEEKL